MNFGLCAFYRSRVFLLNSYFKRYKKTPHIFCSGSTFRPWLTSDCRAIQEFSNGAFCKYCPRGWRINRACISQRLATIMMSLAYSCNIIILVCFIANPVFIFLVLINISPALRLLIFTFSFQCYWSYRQVAVYFYCETKKCFFPRQFN